MSIGVAVLLIAYLAVATSFGSENTFVKHSEDAKRQMELLLTLHVEHCAYISLCTLPGSNFTLELTADQAPCCHRCSCREGCRTAGNCCPDYGFYRIIGHAAFTNVTDVILAMEEHGLFNGTDETKTDNENNTHRSCVHTDLLDSLRVPRGQDYVMVTSCPEGTSADNETVYKCEHPGDSIAGTWPVYCEADLTTYRNIHCLECHGQDVSTAAYWNSVVKCANDATIIFKHFQGPGDVRYALSQNAVLPACNLIFEPDNTMVTTKCTTVNVTECPRVTSGRDYGPVCRDHSLPVEHLNGLVTTGYKNIACFYCNNPYLSFKEGCKDRMFISKLQMQLNIIQSAANHSTDLDMAIDKNNFCQKGNVFDSVKSECRHVLCPKLMYSRDGGCVPLYTDIRPAFYSFQLKATYTAQTEALRHTETLNGRGEQFKEETEAGLLTTLRDCLEDDEMEYDVDFSVHVKMVGSPDTLNGAVQYYFIYVKFWYPGYDGEYLRAAKQGQATLASLSKLKITASFGTVYFQTSLFSSILVRKRQSGPDSVSELTSLNVLQPVHDFKRKTRQLPGMEIPLSISSFCYRITLSFNEMRFQRAHYDILRTREKVYPIDFETDFRTGQPIICVQFLLKEYTNDFFIKQNDVDNVNNDPPTDDGVDVMPGERQRKNSIEIASFVSFAALIVLIVVVAVLRKRCR